MIYGHTSTSILFILNTFFLCVLLSKNAVSQNYIQYKSALSCVVL